MSSKNNGQDPDVLGYVGCALADARRIRPGLRAQELARIARPDEIDELRKTGLI
ncbi:MAG: hypothetical protein U9R74_02930 [Pseudomonadota bacterium]|nr:hypothetical protein [Pseudomonadota bacterium]